MLEFMATTLRVSVIDSYNIKVSCCCCAAAVVPWVKCAPKYKWKNNNNHFVQHFDVVLGINVLGFFNVGCSFLPSLCNFANVTQLSPSVF